MTPGSLSILLLQDRKICRHLTAICISSGEAGPEAKFENELQRFYFALNVNETCQLFLNVFMVYWFVME